jgi:RHS repeat-associated protein
MRRVVSALLLVLGLVPATLHAAPTPTYVSFDASTDLARSYVGARYYASSNGRFTAVDPLLEIDQALVEPQRWNRYAYGLNNPLKYTDPDGRSATLVGGLVGGVIGGGFALVQGRSWREIGAAAAGGAVSGAIFGSVVDSFGATLPVALGAGAVAGVGGTVTENAINGRGTTAGEAAISAAAGAAGAGIGAAAGRALSAAVEPAKSFFAGTTYSAKVLRQMSSGDLHSFPESVTAFESAGRTFWRRGGDGVKRLWLEIPGSYRGHEGVFQFIREADGTINHRLFVPNQ